MGLISFLRKIFRKSDSIDAASMRIDAESINQSITRSINQSIEQYNQGIREIISNKEEKAYPIISNVGSKKEIEQSPITLEKESLKLGMAAGFAGRALVNIENILNRLESTITTKEWMDSRIEKVSSLLEYIKEIISKHEENEQKRFEVLIQSIDRISSTAKNLPEPERSIILSEVETIKKTHLTPKMKELIDIVKSQGEISYAELSQRLGISQDALRGLLSRTLKLTDEIERFERENKGWVRFKLNQSITRSASISKLNQQEKTQLAEEKSEDYTDLP